MIAYSVIVTVLLIMAIVWLQRVKQYRSTIQANRQQLEQMSQQVLNLAHERDLLRDVLDTPVNPIFVIDGNLKLLFANQAMADLFELPVESLLNMTLESLIPDPQQIQRLRLETNQMLTLGETGNMREFTIYDKRRDDQTYYSLTRRNLHNGSEGVVIVATDVTTLKHLMQRYFELQEHYSKLVEYSHNLILKLDAQGQIRYASPVCQKMLGYSQAECLRKSWWDLIHPGDQHKLKAQWGRWSFGTRQKSESRWEFRAVTASGEVRNLLWGITIYWQENDFDGIQADATDITEQKQSQLELIESRNESKRLNMKYEELLKTYESMIETMFVR